MKILISGGAGFIGSHLCERLINDGHSIFCIDNLSSGNLNNISKIRKNSRFKFVNHDITTPFPEIEHDIDEIYHLASLASPKDYNEHPLETALVNTLGTLNTLNLAKMKNAKILISSTSEVYGNPEIHPQNEDYTGALNPFSDRACYAESKRFGETLASIFKRKYDLDIKVVRIFNTYGPRMRKNDGRVIPTFICRALNHDPLLICGDGKQTRSFCYISDIVDGIIQIMNSDCFGPLNLGNPKEEISIFELANRIIGMLNSSSKIIFFPRKIDEPMRRCPDITLVQNLTGWNPKCDLNYGLKRTIKDLQRED